MTDSFTVDGLKAAIAGPADAVARNGRPGRVNGRLHAKNIAITIPERIAIEEVRNDPAYDPSIEQYLKDVDRHLVPYMREAVALVPQVETLRSGVAAQIHTGGKRIRAALCVVCCELFGADYMRALPYAAAIEHIQNLTLIHDDIADGDTERRSRPALWKQYGVPHAINIGDAFIPLGSLSILRALYPDAVKLRLLELVATYGLEMTVGQSIDINLRTRETCSLADYITCTRMKTGAFLAMAVVGGGIIGGGSPEHLELLRRYARLAGVAFQIKDDSLDLTGGKGRQIGSDIVEGKITAHAVYAMNNATPEERVRLRRILAKSRRATQRDEVEWVLALYRRVGAAKFAERTATGMIEAAAQHLLLLPESPQRERLIELSRYLSRRVR